MQDWVLSYETKKAESWHLYLKKSPMPMSVIEVEVLAARRALELAVELGFDHVILEGDSEILHKALLAEDRNFTPYGHLV